MPSLESPDFERYLSAPTDIESNLANDDYEHLAGFCFQAIAQQYPSAPKGNLRAGLRTITRLMKFAATLYADYPEAQQGPEAIEDLRGILLESSQTPVRFAMLPLATNREVEDYFGLTRHQVPGNLAELYHFEPNTSRGTIFIADDEHFALAVGYGREVDPERDSGKHCKMAASVRQELWPQLVNLSADTPSLFANTIGIELVEPAT